MGEPHRFPLAADRDPAQTCKARRADGEPCNRYAMKGQRVCGKHGGKAPQTLAKARRRLEEAADRLAKELLGIAIDPDADANVKLKAIGMALDRAGITTKQTIAIGPDADAPWRDVLENLMVARTTRDGRPLPEEPALPAPRRALAPMMIEGEVVEDDESPTATADLVGTTQPPPSATTEPRPQAGAEPTKPVALPQRTGLVSLEDALYRQQQQRR